MSMGSSTKISGRQAVFLITSTIFSTMVIFLPTFMIDIAKQDAWLAVFPTAVLGIATGNICARLGERFPGKNIIEYAPSIIGRLPGKAVGLIFITTFILLNSYIVREFAEIFLNIFMPETPMFIFIASILLVSSYTVLQGLEVLARANTITLIFYVVIIFTIVSLNLPNYMLDNLTPVLEFGPGRVIGSTYPATVFFAEAYMITMLAPYLDKQRQGRAVVFWGVASAGFLLLVLMLAGLAALKCEAGRTQFIALSLARRISIGEFIERLDPLVMLMWMGGLLIKVTVFYYFTVTGLSSWLGTKGHKAFIIPVGIVLAFMAGYLWDNNIEFRYQLSAILPAVSVPIQLGVPLLLLIIALIRGKGSEKGN
ncbi:MAG: hypothetical protein JL50_17460 [Peptococcaceae bacterium BICA1-7]|nr:MAG: hypothetical protein JL50_17460 [Peptococcaceae bacterium BICA1-7]HBV98664.1 hypothetical protein [Desulfotomaculum sp.]